MENVVVHRIIEHHAAACGDTPAIVHHGESLTYRQLNHQANTVARYLMDQGCHRGGHMLVTMPAGHDLATVLLAVLKAGGAYTWLAPVDRSVPAHTGWSDRVGESRRQFCAIDLSPVLRRSARPGPNLPVLTRPTDIACVLPHARDLRGVLVPHSTITALHREASAGPQPWTGDASTFDLWTGLMAGATLDVREAAAYRNAA